MNDNIMENHLINPYKDYKTNIVKGENRDYLQQKRIHWEQKIRRIKIFLESKGHKFIKYDQSLWYFEGLPPMNIIQLRLYYDRQVYREKI
jgi:hypothetical protein